MRALLLLIWQGLQALTVSRCPVVACQWFATLQERWRCLGLLSWLRSDWHLLPYIVSISTCSLEFSARCTTARTYRTIFFLKWYCCASVWLISMAFLICSICAIVLCAKGTSATDLASRDNFVLRIPFKGCGLETILVPPVELKDMYSADVGVHCSCP